MSPDGRLLVVVAHPDDETFGCGSLLLEARARGMATGVLCATRGEAGEPAPGVAPGAGGLGALREQELRRAAALLGIDRVALLDFTDSGVSGETSPDTLVGAPPEAVAEAVRRGVAAFAPDVLVTLDAGDGHRDHARVRDVTTRVGAELGVPVWWHCLPRSLIRRWLAHMQATRPAAGHLGEDDAALAELGTPDETITVVLDTSAHRAARERAIAAHRSQTSPYDGLPEELRRAFLTADHLRPGILPTTV